MRTLLLTVLALTLAACTSARPAGSFMLRAPPGSWRTSSPPSYSCGSLRNSVQDRSVRTLADGARVRTDLSCTLFLSAPDEYDGGELVIEDSYQPRSIKLAAGDLVLYEANTVHRVEPVSRGERIASFFWVESMVRRADQRELLFNMDRHLMRLRSAIGEQDAAVIGLTSTYHNLLRLWADA